MSLLHCLQANQPTPWIGLWERINISVPTLIAHTKDDQLASHEASKRAAERIPDARFVSLESGGHLMLGQTQIVRDELTEFLAERRERRAKRVAC